MPTIAIIGSYHFFFYSSDLDEDISIEGILVGRRSGESQSSIDKWLKKRAQKKKIE